MSDVPLVSQPSSQFHFPAKTSCEQRAVLVSAVTKRCAFIFVVSSITSSSLTTRTTEGLQGATGNGPSGPNSRAVFGCESTGNHRYHAQACRSSPVSCGPSGSRGRLGRRCDIPASRPPIPFDPQGRQCRRGGRAHCMLRRPRPRICAGSGRRKQVTGGIWAAVSRVNNRCLSGACTVRTWTMRKGSPRLPMYTPPPKFRAVDMSRIVPKEFGDWYTSQMPGRTSREGLVGPVHGERPWKCAYLHRAWISL